MNDLLQRLLTLRLNKWPVWSLRVINQISWKLWAGVTQLFLRPLLSSASDTHINGANIYKVLWSEKRSNRARPSTFVARLHRYRITIRPDTDQTRLDATIIRFKLFIDQFLIQLLGSFIKDCSNRINLNISFKYIRWIWDCLILLN